MHQAVLSVAVFGKLLIVVCTYLLVSPAESSGLPGLCIEGQFSMTSAALSDVSWHGYFLPPPIVASLTLQIDWMFFLYMSVSFAALHIIMCN